MLFPFGHCCQDGPQPVVYPSCRWQFLGQMYQPHAAETRVAMGTLEGLRHREYVEGTDEEYLTLRLTIADCSFNRFNRVSARNRKSTGRDGSSKNVSICNQNSDKPSAIFTGIYDSLYQIPGDTANRSDLYLQRGFNASS
jgi:hypothetical protein